MLFKFEGGGDNEVVILRELGLDLGFKGDGVEGSIFLGIDFKDIDLGVVPIFLEEVSGQGDGTF